MLGGTRRFLGSTGEALFGSGADSQAYVKGTGRFIAQAAEGRSMTNLWTGKTLGPAGRPTVAAGIVGGLGIYAMNVGGKEKDKEIQAMAAEDNIQSLPGTQADGVGYTAFPSLNMQDYSPNGDLVFALHKNRHG